MLGGVISGNNGRICDIQGIPNGSVLDSFEGIGYYDEGGQHSSLPSYSGIVISVKCGKLRSNSTTSGIMQILFSFVTAHGVLSLEKKYRYYDNGAWSAWTDM